MRINEAGDLILTQLEEQAIAEENRRYVQRMRNFMLWIGGCCALYGGIFWYMVVR